MSGRTTEKAISINGNVIPEIGKARLSLVIRLVPEEEFRLLTKTESIPQLAKRFDLSNHDIQGLIHYYEIDYHRKNGGQPNSIKIDVIAERVYELVEERMEHTIDAQANRLWLKIEPLIDKKFEEWLR